MKHLPTTRQIQYFISLSELHSFSKAAKKCYITQSTLSAAIQDLEDLLKVKLVDRSARQISLTSAGEELIPLFKSILDSNEELIERAKNITHPEGGILKLGIIPTIAPYILPTILPTIKNKAPDLKIKIIENLSDNLLDLINNKELDIIIMALPYPTPSLEQKELFKEDFLLITNNNNQNISDTISIEETNDLDLLMMEDGHCLKDHAMQACHISGKNINQSIRASSINTLIELVSQNYGSTLIPRMCLKSMHNSNKIKIINFNNPKPTRSIGAVWNKKHGNQNQINNFINIINSEL